MQATTPTSKLSTHDWAELERRIRMAGGHAEAGRCEGTVVTFDGTARGEDRTCCCGELRRVSVPYAPLGAAPEDRTAVYTACANCDAVYRQPRFAGPRES